VIDGRGKSKRAVGGLTKRERNRCATLKHFIAVDMMKIDCSMEERRGQLER
jgi:hypothetical protein